MKTLITLLHKLLRLSFLPALIVVLMCVLRGFSGDMPKDYFSKKIKQYEAESEKHELSLFLPDSSFFELYPDTIK